MQVLLAGWHKFLLLELDPDFIAGIAKQAGFEYRIEESQRSMNLHLSAVDRQAPLLLFDAADPGNLGWFSRCQFYVDGKTGTVLQTPMSLANQKDRPGRTLSSGFGSAADCERAPRVVPSAGQTGSDRTDCVRCGLQFAPRAADY